MIFYFLLMVTLIFGVFRARKSKNPAFEMSSAFFNIILVAGGVLFLGSILMGVTMNATVVSLGDKKTAIEPVDNETLNGRNFYLITNPDKTYTYILKDKDGSIEPQFVNIEDVKVFQDEEIKPYTVAERTKYVKRDLSWLMPNMFAKIQNKANKGIENLSEVTEIHIPVNSVRYYIPGVPKE